MEKRMDSELNGKYPPHLEHKKKKMMKRRRKIRIKRRFIVFMFVLACAVVILTVFKAPFFDIKEIVCKGQGDLPPEEIIKISGLSKNENIFSAGVQEAEENLKKHPEIDHATVQRSFPNKIEIEIKRAVPVAYVELGTKVLIIDKKGAIIRTASADDVDAVNGLAKIQGVSVASEDAGKVFAAKDDVRASELYSCMGILEKVGMLNKINNMDFSDLSDIKLEYEDRLQIVIGDSDKLDYKIKFVNKIITDRLSAHERVKINCRGDEFVVGPRDDENTVEEEKSVEDEEQKAEDSESDDETDTAEN